MKVKFNKLFSRDWIAFPICVVWHNELFEYFPPAKRIEIHFLWWHCGWTFIKERRADNERERR